MHSWQKVVLIQAAKGKVRKKKNKKQHIKLWNTEKQTKACVLRKHIWTTSSLCPHCSLSERCCKLALSSQVHRTWKRAIWRKTWLSQPLPPHGWRGFATIRSFIPWEERRSNAIIRCSAQIENVSRTLQQSCFIGKAHVCESIYVNSYTQPAGGSEFCPALRRTTV